MTYNAPGKSHRCGMTLIEIMGRFPTELAAVKWFEMAGRRLTYRALIADNGLPSGAYG